MSEHSNGDGSSRNCNVSHVPLWMCTEVKMVLTLGDRVERMQNVNSLADNLLQGPWSPAYYSFIVATRGFMTFCYVCNSCCGKIKVSTLWISQL